MKPESLKALKLLWTHGEGDGGNGCTVKWYFLIPNWETICPFYSRWQHCRVTNQTTRVKERAPVCCLKRSLSDGIWWVELRSPFTALSFVVADWTCQLIVKGSSNIQLLKKLYFSPKYFAPFFNQYSSGNKTASTELVQCLAQDSKCLLIEGLNLCLFKGSNSFSWLNL